MTPEGEPIQDPEAVTPVDSDADLLQGLSALADLFTDASQTLNQCLLTLENKLSSMIIAQAEWVPIQTARSAVERVARPDERQQSQERTFGGVPVTIMRMSAPSIEPPVAQRCEWQYELGYSVAGDQWALMIRTASYDPSNQNHGFEYSDVMLLRGAPLELRLKAIREIPVLLRLLAEGSVDLAAPADAVAPDEVNAADPATPAQLSLFA